MVGTFQGLPLRSVTLRRSRSWGGDESELLAVVPPDFDLDLPETRDLAYVPDRPSPLEPEGAAPGRLESVGFVRLLQSIDGLPVQTTQPEPGPWVHVAGPLFVVRAEEVKRSRSGWRTVKIGVVDERYFWSRGVLSRWSYNRRLGSGVVALDSVKPDGSLFTRREAAEAAVASLPRRPRLAVAPPAWSDDRSSIEFRRWGRAVDAVAELARAAGLEEPCLRWDGTVGLHAPGEGFLGYAPNGEGPNTLPIPSGMIMWKEGAGEGQVAEPAWPEDYALVVGGERVASVAVDAWEPVLQLPPDGRYVPLTEEIVRELVGPKFASAILAAGGTALGWLARFVLRPSAYQANPFLDPEVASLLAEQAWRLFRLRKAVVRRNTGVSLFEPLRDEPGPNAHLLPLLDRAETDGSGRRLAPQVETYHFAAVHHELQSSVETDVLAEIRKQIARVRATITPAVLSGSRGAVGEKGGIFNLLTADDAIGGADFQAWQAAIFAGTDAEPVSFADFQAFLRRAREIEQYRGTPQGDTIADELKRLTREELAQLERAGGLAGQDELFDAAYEVLEAEDQLREILDALPDGDLIDGALAGADDLRGAFFDPKNAAIKDILRIRLEELIEKVAAERVAAKDRARTTAPEGTAITEAVGLLRYVNQKRSIDTEARVESEAAGVIRTSRLAGIVTPDQVGDLSRASFVPCPVRVVFGATLRPRVDVVSGRPTSPAPSSPPAQRFGDFRDFVNQQTDDLRSDLAPPPEPDVVPEVLSDQGTFYVAAFERFGQRRARQIRVADAQLDRAVPLEDEDLVELVTLDGKTNRGQLDDAAQRRAVEAFDTPDVIRSSCLAVAHVWPVQCDGKVAAVEIRTRFKGDVPCGFETLITTGSTPIVTDEAGRTQSRPARPVRGRAAAREGLIP